ncbi:hypothetical protein AYO40_03155 [Planctomycetaceae bacterium SCGC AG-212-D15]|nr:hypothetical protein AYO40_03155 [Planctomycetaceae bacterium SCGC AG-212-D15]
MATLPFPCIPSNEQLGAVLAVLPSPERYVLERRLAPQAPSFAAIATDMRLTRQRVAQLEASALRRLGASIPSLAALNDGRSARPRISRREAAADGLRSGKGRVRQSRVEADYERAINALLSNPCRRNEARATRLARLCIAA